jgi:hypothetical protein
MPKRFNIYSYSAKPQLARSRNRRKALTGTGRNEEDNGIDTQSRGPST